MSNNIHQLWNLITYPCPAIRETMTAMDKGRPFYMMRSTAADIHFHYKYALDFQQRICSIMMFPN